MKKITYNGESKILIALCDLVNELVDAVGSTGDGDMKKSVYDTNGDGIVDNAEKVNNHSVNANVPEDAKFTDSNTTYTLGKSDGKITLTDSDGLKQEVDFPEIEDSVKNSKAYMEKAQESASSAESSAAAASESAAAAAGSKDAAALSESNAKASEAAAKASEANAAASESSASISETNSKNYYDEIVKKVDSLSVIDTEMSDDSINAVQNKVIKAYVDSQKDETLEWLKAMVYTNNYWAQLRDESGNPILDENSNSILGNWSYIER